MLFTGAMLVAMKGSSISGVSFGLVDMCAQLLCNSEPPGLDKSAQEGEEAPAADAPDAEKDQSGLVEGLRRVPLLNLQRSWRCFALGTVAGVGGSVCYLAHAHKLAYAEAWAAGGAAAACWTPVYFMTLTGLDAAVQRDCPKVLLVAMLTSTAGIAGTALACKAGFVAPLTDKFVRQILLSWGCGITSHIGFGFVNKYQQFRARLQCDHPEGRWCGITMGAMRAFMRIMALWSGNLLTGAVAVLPFVYHTGSSDWYILTLVLFPASVHASTLNQQSGVASETLAKVLQEGESKKTDQEVADAATSRVGRELLPVLVLPYGFSDGLGLPWWANMSFEGMAVGALAFYFTMYSYEWRALAVVNGEEPWEHPAPAPTDI
eukprot:TRINITY_DN50437_c0_g1_i1.p2 TRINITY_DN50437_c0_g1~~TRINITY_DN50437_c0_g1_i1.p2  ORF type:complete len:376 (+),score=105.42 TRINITY_DN50437_c0_g1_i1:91-1218(+)